MLFGFRYPKLIGLVAAIILAYIIFSNQVVAGFFSRLGALSYLGIFIAGLFFSFGFTSPFAAGVFITTNPSNIWLAALLGGVGAMLSDLFIFNVIRFSFMDEFQKLKRTKILKSVEHYFENGLAKKIRTYLLYAFAGFLIASPLPDEAGIIILAGLTRIKQKILALIGLVLNTLGILILLLI